jgi:hypothetical protein
MSKANAKEYPTNAVCMAGKRLPGLVQVPNNFERHKRIFPAISLRKALVHVAFLLEVGLGVQAVEDLGVQGAVDVGVQRVGGTQYGVVAGYPGISTIPSYRSIPSNNHRRTRSRQRERFFIGLVTSDCKLKVSRKGSK